MLSKIKYVVVAVAFLLTSARSEVSPALQSTRAAVESHPEMARLLKLYGGAVTEFMDYDDTLGFICLLPVSIEGYRFILTVKATGKKELAVDIMIVRLRDDAPPSSLSPIDAVDSGDPPIIMDVKGEALKRLGNTLDYELLSRLIQATKDHHWRPYLGPYKWDSRKQVRLLSE